MIDRKNIPVVVECCADNGEHSHFKLIDVETGDCLWEESETADNTDCTATAMPSPKSCRRSGDCSFERIEGRCLGELCGVFDPA